MGGLSVSYLKTTPSDPGRFQLIKGGTIISEGVIDRDPTCIKDMEIFEDTLYFCGINMGIPVFGFVDLNDFLGSGVLNIRYFDGPGTTTGATDFIPYRMDVFRVIDDIHIVAVGSCYERYLCRSTYISDLIWNRRLNRTTIHYENTHYLYNVTTSNDHIYDKERHEDIAVTDNNVVVIGRNLVTSDVMARAFAKPRTMNTSIFPNDPIDDVRWPEYPEFVVNAYLDRSKLYNLSANATRPNNPDKKVFLTHTQGENFSVAYPTKVQVGDNTEYGVTVLELEVNGEGLIESRNEIDMPMYSSTETPIIQDIRYDENNDIHLLLVEGTMPFHKNCVYLLYDCMSNDYRPSSITLGYSTTTFYLPYSSSSTLMIQSVDKFLVGGENIPHLLSTVTNCDDNEALIWSTQIDLAGLSTVSYLEGCRDRCGQEFYCSGLPIEMIEDHVTRREIERVGTADINIPCSSPRVRRLCATIRGLSKGEAGLMFSDLELEQQTNVKVYPNPTVDYLDISSDEVIDMYEVYDLNGKKILSNQAESGMSRVDVSKLVPGAYLLVVYTEQGLDVKKIIKN